MYCVQRTGLGLCRLKNEMKPCIFLFNNSRLFCDKGNKLNDKDEKTKAAKKKLLALLSDMTSDTFTKASKDSNIGLARPNQHLRPKVTKTREENSEEKKTSMSEEMISAVKGVASIAGSEAKQIEDELTESIQSINLITKEIEESVSKKKEILEGEVTQHMTSVVDAVAATMSGENEHPQSELAKKLLSLSSAGSESFKRSKIENIFQGMKIEGAKETYRENGRREEIDIKPTSRRNREVSTKPEIEEIVDLFGDVPLNAFTVPDEDAFVPLDESDVLWTKMKEKELKYLVTFAPTNAFEEMIQLTEQGKHWKFPIDNDADSGPEENVGFHEHVFLENHLHSFPTKGPIRHFMELVAIGLSKNPYITVERKIENINWYRQYFKEKEHILNEYGVLDEK